MILYLIILVVTNIKYLNCSSQAHRHLWDPMSCWHNAIAAPSSHVFPYFFPTHLGHQGCGIVQKNADSGVRQLLLVILRHLFQGSRQKWAGKSSPGKSSKWCTGWKILWIYPWCSPFAHGITKGWLTWDHGIWPRNTTTVAPVQCNEKYINLLRIVPWKLSMDFGWISNWFPINDLDVIYFFMGLRLHPITTKKPYDS